MARPAAYMTSLGTEHERCDGCGNAIPRGVQMTAIELDNGDPAGWFCPACIDEWKRTGKPPKGDRPQGSE